MFTVSPYQTRISTATVGDAVSLVFDFTSKTSSSTVITAINEISDEYGATPNIKDALDFVRGTMFTTENGARSDVSDVLIMLISDVSTIGSDESAQTLKDNGVFLMVAKESYIFSSASLIQSIADVYETFYTPVENKLSDALTAITTGLPCNYCKHLLLHSFYVI